MKRVEKHEVHGGGGDGTALVIKVYKNKHGMKLVNFVSLEAKKAFTISKAHFVGRFPETLTSD